MEPTARNSLLACCAKRCANTEVLAAYQKHFDDVHGDRDAFYAQIHTLSGVRGEIIVPGREYRLIFPACTCDLHTTADVRTPALCECSRQSILYVGRSIWGTETPLQVIPEETILSGGSECRFRVIFG